MIKYFKKIIIKIISTPSSLLGGFATWQSPSDLVIRAGRISLKTENNKSGLLCRLTPRNDGRRKYTTGFTLIETLVAVGLFSIVIMVSVTALMTILAANAKVQNIKTAVNNVSFAVETISSYLMSSSPDYIECLDTSLAKTDCENGTGYIGLNFLRSLGTDKYAYQVYFSDSSLSIKKGAKNDQAIVKADGSITYIFTGAITSKLIPSNVTITNTDGKIFYVNTFKVDNVVKAKRTEIILSGTIGNDTRGTKTSFNLQTGATLLGI